MADLATPETHDEAVRHAKRCPDCEVQETLHHTYIYPCPAHRG